MKGKLIKLNSDLVRAEKALTRELEKIFPVGTRIVFKIACNQVNDSFGEVLCYYAPYLRVKMDTAKGKAIDVHFDKAEKIQ